MQGVATSPYQSALEHIDLLALEDQEVLIEEVHYRLIDRRRSEIARNAEETVSQFRRGQADTGSIDDLRRALAGEA